MNFTRIGRRAIPVFFIFTLLSVRPAHAVSKEMVQLQTQVQQLIDSLARLQSANDQQLGVLKDLVQQTVDSVNKMTVTVNGMQLKLGNQGDAQSARNDQLSGQVQALNDSLDELKARMMRMEKTLSDVQSQAQSTNAMIGNLPGANGAGGATGSSAGPAAGSPIPAPAPPQSAAPAGPPSANNSTDLSPNGGTASTEPTAAAADGPAPLVGGAAVGVMYRTAYNDYVSGKYPLASSEFRDLIKAHPDDNLSGNAYFYLGEMDVRNDKPSAAIGNYNQVLERYPDNPKIPAARLHKGEALIATKQNEAGVRELRALIQRYPNSPEASQARSRLRTAGASADARR